MIFKIYKKLICLYKEFILNRYNDGTGKIKVVDHELSIRIIKRKNARLEINGILSFGRHLMGGNMIRIVLLEGALFKIENNLSLGNGCGIAVGKDATLLMKGTKKESQSGFTADSQIMVKKRIEIGYDFLGAWRIFITDFDWHPINGKAIQKDVIINDHVWIANSVNILKGSIIGAGCIIASNSKLAMTKYPENSLVAGTPGKVIKENIFWER